MPPITAFPQRRLRVFFVGIRADLDAGWSFPAPTHSLDELLREKYVTGEYWLQHGLEPSPAPPRFARKINDLRPEPLFRGKDRWLTVRDALSDLPKPGGNGGIANHAPQPGAKVYPGHTGSPMDEPAKALEAGDHGVPGGENMLRHANGKVRYFTVREAARVQTFPDDFFFAGSWTENMRQLGNAVPVRLAQGVASSVAAKIRSITPNSCPKSRQTED